MSLSITDTPTDDQLAAARARIAYTGRLLFERFLADAAGGNLSVRVGNRVCITPRYSGSQRHWQLSPEDVLVADLDRNILSGVGQISRESNVHFTLHREFSEHGTAVIHAHSRNLLVFAAAARPLPPVLEATRKFGETPVVDFAPAHSPKLAQHIATAMRGREARIRNHAAGVIAPYHGLFLMGKDLDAAFDAVERLDNKAYCILMGSLLVGSAAVYENQRQMEATIGHYHE
jgi:L-fuculose-phosphate aldolase